jgi:hypothetical protein
MRGYLPQPYVPAIRRKRENMATITSIQIPGRFSGPPFGANGGYTAGLLAEHAGVRSAHVEISAPVPMDRPVEVVTDAATASLTHHGKVLATAAPVVLIDMSHPAVDFVTATVAAGDVDPTGHPFPGCFVCGPGRARADGLHLLPGPVGQGVVAVPWTPAAWQADPTGTVPVRIVTAALDCPSAFPVLEPGAMALLVSMTFGIERLPMVGEHLVVTGWKRRVQGRKLFTSSAVATADGETIARADALWIGIDSDRLSVLADSMRGSAA